MGVRSATVNIWRPLAVVFVTLTLLTGIVYPLAVTAIGQLLFPHEASGSLLATRGTVIGSSLIAQPFSDPKHFWGRVSATSPMPNNAAGSTASNLGPTNPALLDSVKARIADLKAADPDNALPIPVDLVTASGSGLDPHISPAAAFYQVDRVARARHIAPEVLRALVQERIEGPQWGILGEPRVNVLLLNLALDRAQ
jgi:K+-transporting ATPase ATPase C chain